MDVLFVSNKKLQDSRHALIHAHMQYWKQVGNNITICSNIADNRKLEKDGYKVVILKVPAILLSIAVSLWKLFKKARFDIYISLISSPFSWKLYSRKKSFIVVDFTSRIFEAFLIKLLNKKHKLLVTNRHTYGLLAGRGIRRSNLLMLAKEIEIPRSLPKKQKMIIGFAERRGELNEVLGVFNGIERKELDWKYVLATNEMSKADLKNAIDKKGMLRKVKIIVIKDIGEIKHSLKKARFLIVSDATNNTQSMLNLAKAYGCIPMRITDAFIKESKSKYTQKGNVYQLVDSVLKLKDNQNEFTRLQKGERSTLAKLSRENIEKESIRFIESV